MLNNYVYLTEQVILETQSGRLADLALEVRNQDVMIDRNLQHIMDLEQQVSYVIIKTGITSPFFFQFIFFLQMLLSKEANIGFETEIIFL